MKLSTKGRYGLRALADLAANAQDGPVSLSETSGRQKISLNYLEQIFGKLSRAGIVTGVKGAGGGYKLARDMDQITAGEVLRALEGEISVVDAGEPSDPVQAAAKSLLWDEIDRRVNGYLDELTLGGLVRKYQKNLERQEIR